MNKAVCAKFALTDTEQEEQEARQAILDMAKEAEKKVGKKVVKGVQDLQFKDD